MEGSDLKKFLAGLCIASLLAGTSLGLAGCQKKAQTS